MIKNIKKIIISTFLVTAIALPSTAFATTRNIQQFYGFSLPAYKTVVSTSAQYKIKTNAPWVMNITKMSYTNSVSTYLADTSGNRVSDYATYSGGKLTINDWGQANTKYKAVLMNAVNQSSDAFIDGSWSPDDANY